MLKRLLVVVVLCVLAGCSGGSTTPAAGKKKVVGVTLLTETHAFYKELEDGLRDAAKENNLDLVIVACEMDPAKQAAQIEDFVAQKVSAILAAPCDSSAIVPQLAGPERAGIPVFTADIASAGGKIVSHVASDNVQGGRLAAQALAQAIGDTGAVIVIDHPTVASVQDRVRGFEEEMKNHPNITIAGKPSADGQRAKAMAVMEDALQAHRDLKGVFGINDDSALAALSVLDAARRTDVAIVGYDATPDQQAAIRKGGPLKASVAQSPRTIGRTAIETIAKHLAGQPVPARVAIDVAIVNAQTLGKS